MKKLNHITKTLALIAPLFAGACSIDSIRSADVDPDAIYMAYTALASETNSKVQTIATFRVGGSTGTTIDLDDPAEHRVNGTRLNSQLLLGTHYYGKVNKGDPSTSITYQFKDGEGREFSNTFTVNTIYMQNAPTSASSQSELRVKVTLPVALLSGDSVSGTITQPSTLPDGSDSKIVSGQYNSSTGEVVFSASEMAKLRPNTDASLYVNRLKGESIPATKNKGGYFSGSFTSRTQNVRIN